MFDITKMLESRELKPNGENNHFCIADTCVLLDGFTFNMGRYFASCVVFFRCEGKYE